MSAVKSVLFHYRFFLAERLAQQENLTTALNSTIFRLSPCINGRSEREHSLLIGFNSITVQIAEW